MRNLREKKVKVTADGQVIEYASIRAAADALDTKYQNVLNWVHHVTRCSIPNTTVEFA